jgi:hypothetical protein
VSTEQREIRPFNKVSTLDSIVKGCELHLGAQHVPAGGNLAVSAADYAERRLRIALPWENEEEAALAVKEATAELESAGYTADRVAFVAVAQSKFLKLRDVIAVIRLSELHDITSINVEERPAALRTPRSGSEIGVSFVLLEGGAPQMLRAWRKSTWLHHATFKLSTNLSQLGFTPRPLTDEERTSQELPKGTLRYIVLKESPLDEGVSEEMVEMWVDSDLLHSLSTQPNSPASRVMQAQLFVDCVSEIISSALKDPALTELGWQDVQDTLLGRVIVAIVPPPPSHRIDEGISHYGGYLDLLRQDPSKLMAYAEELAELRKRHKEALEV